MFVFQAHLNTGLTYFKSSDTDRLSFFYDITIFIQSISQLYFRVSCVISISSVIKLQ